MSSGNAEWWRRAQAVIPGGVNSPVRAFKAVPGDPLFFGSADRGRFRDENGKSYIDYCQSWGPLILGHNDPDVREAITGAAAEGLSFGAPSRREVLLAEKFLEMLPIFERVRFVNSGTEAVMSAVRLARGTTGRDLIVKFEGCYHGHADHLLVEAGSGLATFGNPSSAGVPADFSKQTAVLPLDDDEALAAFFSEHGDKCAALIIEPIPANAGLLQQRPEFLQACRDLTRNHGALLIFDEVISGFRVGPGGAAMHYGIEPDLATYGKIIGGGLPVGAYAGSEKIMSNIAPLGAVYQAGTLSGNPLAMAAGLATLQKISAPGFYEALAAKAAQLADGMQGALAASGTEACLQGCASLFWLAFQKEAPRAFSDINPEGIKRFAAFHAGMIAEGVYLAPSGYEVGFLAAAHSEKDINDTVSAAARVLATLSEETAR
jgi:glutamate-1-semialdehyde 2,1-aminomutase